MPSILVSIKGRLFLATLLTAVLTFAAIATTFVESNLIRKDFRYQSTVITPLAAAVRGMNSAGLNQGSLLREQLLTNNLNNKEVAALKQYSVVFTQDAKTANRLGSDFPTLLAMLKEISKDWRVVKAARDKIQTALANVQPG
ncbi:MAG TPA: hypothetical protein VE197_07835, partial [Mycobacterium sp.]|nr:hypothetical protein [Mycobacterium sp.]